MFAKICTSIGPEVGEGKRLQRGYETWESGPKDLPFHVRLEAKDICTYILRMYIHTYIRLAD
jgi:hypothetical protein